MSTIHFIFFAISLFGYFLNEVTLKIDSIYIASTILFIGVIAHIVYRAKKEQKKTIGYVLLDHIGLLLLIPSILCLGLKHFVPEPYTSGMHLMSIGFMLLSVGFSRKKKTHTKPTKHQD